MLTFQVFYKAVRDIQPGEEMLLYARDALYPEIELETMAMHKLADGESFGSSSRFSVGWLCGGWSSSIYGFFSSVVVCLSRVLFCSVLLCFCRFFFKDFV